MATTQVLIAGFGGQGVLFAGKFLAYKGLIADKQVSWLPSYGPEMRGGTANCSVIISDEPVGSPIVGTPDILVAMNLPSLKKYENDVVSGGIIIVDSALISEKVERDDVTTYYVPATKMATAQKRTPRLHSNTTPQLLTVDLCAQSVCLQKATKRLWPRKKKSKKASGIIWSLSLKWITSISAV